MTNRFKTINMDDVLSTLDQSKVNDQDIVILVEDDKRYWFEQMALANYLLFNNKNPYTNKQFQPLDIVEFSDKIKENVAIMNIIEKFSLPDYNVFRHITETNLSDIEISVLQELKKIHDIKPRTYFDIHHIKERLDGLSILMRKTGAFVNKLGLINSCVRGDYHILEQLFKHR